MYGAPPQKPPVFFWIAQSKHVHPRYPKTHFLAHCVQRYGCLGRQPRTQTIFFCIVHFKHTHPRYRKPHFLAHCVQRYVWTERHPRTQTMFFLALFISNTPIPGIKNTFSGPLCAEVCVYGAPPQNPNNIFWHGPFQTPSSQVSKTTFSGP